MSSIALAAGHYVQLFDDDLDHVTTVANFVREALAAGRTCIVVATPEHRSGIREQLYAHGFDAASLAARYQYIELDARTQLDAFMEGGRCNHERFHRMFDTLMRQAASRGEPISAYGEMVNLLVEDGLPEIAIQLEEIWNELSRHHDFALYCGYSLPTLNRVGNGSHLIRRICAAHTHTITN